MTPAEERTPEWGFEDLALLIGAIVYFVRIKAIQCNRLGPVPTVTYPVPRSQALAKPSDQVVVDHMGLFQHIKYPVLIKVRTAPLLGRKRLVPFLISDRQFVFP